ncbi:MAG TPA: hypothetical protein PLQ59_05490, partial [Fervidobacterium sp.]|nr:hypothetical protein [Fervidobacterium sp.]
FDEIVVDLVDKVLCVFITWGDALFAFLQSKNVGIWVSSFFDEIVVDLVDKVLCVFITFGIFKALPKTLVYTFKGEE